MPLNPILYESIQRNLSRIARVQAPGQEAMPLFERTLKGSRWTFTRGEYYVALCPWCEDTSGHLYISYLFGVWQPEYETRGYELAHCFHDCLAEPGRARELYDRLYLATGTMNARGPHIKDIGKGMPYSPPAQVDPPGSVVLLSELPDRHQAVEYIRGRGYDTEFLSQYYRVGYCRMPSDDYPQMNHRIVIPVYSRGKYVGWQGRTIGPHSKYRPKYYNWEHFSKSNYLYGFDNAAEFKTIVRVEGVTDVWSVGPQAVSTFGTSLSQPQCDQLCELVGLDGVLIWFYDMNSKDGAGLPDHPAMIATLEHLRTKIPGRVLEAVLPMGTDPGSFDQTFLRNFLNDVMRRAGVPWDLDARRTVPVGQPERRLVWPIAAV